jgi:hypothetical protein
VLRETEVEELRLPTLGDEDVGGLDIAVDDAVLMRRVEAVGDLHGQLQQVFGREGLLAQVMLERAALHQLHDDELLAVVLADVEDGADAGMIQRARQPRLALEAFGRARLRQQRRGQEFDRHLATEPGVLGAIHDTHPPATELVENAVVPDVAARQRDLHAEPADYSRAGVGPPSVAAVDPNSACVTSSSGKSRR